MFSRLEPLCSSFLPQFFIYLKQFATGLTARLVNSSYYNFFNSEFVSLLFYPDIEWYYAAVVTFIRHDRVSGR